VQYLLLIYNNPTVAATEDELDALVRGHTALYRELADAGKVVSAASLTDGPAAATLRIHDGVPAALSGAGATGGAGAKASDLAAVTDGPFLEAKEYLAGYYQVECETLDEAIGIAGRIPCAPHGHVEIRAVEETITRTVHGAGG
jgi:hypothetical protein